VAQLAILGAGDDGCALAERAALAGFLVRLHDPDAGALSAAHDRIRASIDAGVAGGRLAASDRQRALDAILTTTDLAEALTHGDLVVEAGDRPARARRDLFLQLGDLTRASALVATTRGDPDALADWLPNPGRLFALRVGPPPRVVIAPGRETSAEVLAAAGAFRDRLGAAPGGKGA
jgi:3-hydroxybutyryl-CoA dehydrogenase